MITRGTYKPGGFDSSYENYTTNWIFTSKQIRNENHHFFYFRINIAGNWIPVSYNPGLHARNRYGHQIFKHSQHWLELGKPSCK